MTISANYKPLVYVGNGIVTNFVITWKFFDKEVVVTDEYGRQLGGYEVINSDNGGTVIFATAPVGKIVISRKVGFNQSIEFNEGEDFPAKDYEYSLDRIYMALQQLGYNVERSVELPEGFDNLGDVLKDFVSMNAESRGIYNENITYLKGAFCVDEEDMVLYYRYGESVKGQRPSQNRDGWQPVANFTTEVSLDDYYTKEEVNSLVSGYYTKEEIDSKIGDIDSVLDSINGEVV